MFDKYNIKKVFDSIFQWLKHDWVTKLISLIFAIILWFFVSQSQSPIVEKIFTSKLNYYGVSKNLIIENRENYIDVYLKGPQNILNKMSLSDLNVFVDLSDVEKPGKYKMNIDISFPSGIKLAKISPNYIYLTILGMNSKFFLVKPTYLEKISNCENFKEYTIKLTPNLVKIGGIKKNIDKIEYVTFFLTDELRNELSKKLRYIKIFRVYALDKRGRIVDNVIIEPNIIEAVFEKKKK